MLEIPSIRSCWKITIGKAWLYVAVQIALFAMYYNAGFFQMYFVCLTRVTLIPKPQIAQTGWFYNIIDAVGN
jgi:hypothetical protein